MTITRSKYKYVFPFFFSHFAAPGICTSVSRSSFTLPIPGNWRRSTLATSSHCRSKGIWPRENSSATKTRQPCSLLTSPKVIWSKSLICMLVCYETCDQVSLPIKTSFILIQSWFSECWLPLYALSCLFSADLGDFMDDLYVDHTYLSNHNFVPNQTTEFEQKVRNGGNWKTVIFARYLRAQWAEWLWNRRVEYWAICSWESGFCPWNECVYFIQFQPTVHHAGIKLLRLLSNSIFKIF